VEIEHLVAAESGWRAVFKEPDGGESLSRILGWAIGGDGDVVGLIVDPTEPARIIAAAGAASPGGGTFLRYRYIAPEPPPPPPPPPKSDEPPDPEEAATQLAKGILRRRK
jgi:hypothetical protein